MYGFCEIEFAGCDVFGDLRVDPYESDVNNNDVEKIICNHCFNALCDEI